jgi:hypothetical protein
MEELLKTFSFTTKDLTLYVEIIAAIIGSIYFYKYKNSYLKYFLVFLWYIVFNEIYGKYIADVLDGNNFGLYNIYMVINLLFLLSIYWNKLKKSSNKKLIVLFAISFITVCIVNYPFQDYTIDFAALPFIVGSSLLIFAIILYFIEILNSEKVLYTTRDLLFWISFGILLFNVGAIPCIVARTYYFETFHLNFGFLNTLYLSLIFILNICYIIGFICSHKIIKKQQQQQQ